MALVALLSLVGSVLIIAWRRPTRGSERSPSGFEPGTLRGRLTVGLLLLAVVPPLAVVAALTYHGIRTSEAAHAAQIAANSRQVARHVDEYLALHVLGIRAAALALAETPALDRPVVERWLERTHRLYPGFLTMVAVDATGHVEGATRRTEAGPSVMQGIDVNVSDRSYFRQAMDTGGPYVSEVFQGRRLGTDPIVAISAAVDRERDGRWGIVQGALDLAALRRFERTLLGGVLQKIVITDSRGAVVFASSGTGLDYLADASGSPLLGWSASEGAAYPVELQESHRGRTLLAARARSDFGWNVVVLMPTKDFATEFVQRLGNSMPWLALSMLCGALLARMLANAVASPVEALVDRASTLRLDSPPGHFLGMRRMPREFRSLTRQLHRMSWRLRATHRALGESVHASQRARAELQQALESQERQITERTRTLAEANAELKRLSTTDSLTQLPNRRRFNEFMAQAVRNAARDGKPITCFLIDVDHFKAYNDTYGHQPGDWCLRAVGSALRVAVNRPLDMVARYGGEEFAIVVLDTPPEGAAVVAERARQAVEDLEIEHSASRTSKHVTISVGGCTFWPQQDTVPQDMLARADAALYAAKQGGRNVCAFQEPDGSIRLLPHSADEQAEAQKRTQGAADRLMQMLRKRGKTAG